MTPGGAGGAPPRLRAAAAADGETRTRLVRASAAYDGVHRRIAAPVRIAPDTLRRDVVRVYDGVGES